MTTKQITKGNILIAKFLGEEVKNGMLVSINNLFGYNTTTLHSMIYNSDWSEIMKAVEKIESIKDDFHGYFGVYIHSNCCTIQGSKLNTSVENFHPAYFLESYGDTKIEAVYLAVIQFIKFWNDKERKDSQGEENQTTQNIN